ncbi:DUF6233 domain-containing protein [Streptomyces sp. SP18CS02]|uniref:DUF6233 domain-containing protein n=1 Tax=Streptomyces sp. SP18CS02 TaxID=3002531 RepID=UPI002E775A27|nr:DUF6233 domain-containing protein [Streptomyces sp. SP18CS02]MEE1753003.1 DUF6233 domain-containing protein [Streptomyces sp. SP18CS02]
MPDTLPPPYPPDDERLAAIEAYLTVQLMHVRQQRAAVARRQEIQQRTAPPPVPAYRIQRGLDAIRTPVQVHLGTCALAGKGAAGVTEEAARRALADQVRPCAVCRPETELGMIDG